MAETARMTSTLDFYHVYTSENAQKFSEICCPLHFHFIHDFVNFRLVTNGFHNNLRSQRRHTSPRLRLVQPRVENVEKIPIFRVAAPDQRLLWSRQCCAAWDGSCEYWGCWNAQKRGERRRGHGFAALRAHVMLLPTASCPKH